MSRILGNWLDTYVDYTDNKFAPRAFHLWSGLSLIAAALERKVWLPWDDTFSYFPNIYVFLVALPGVGKSSALNKAISLARDLNLRAAGTIELLPSQMSEARLIDILTTAKSYQYGTIVKRHASAYYHASEASNSLKPMAGGGDLVPGLTDFYDCPDLWEKGLMKEGHERKVLHNVCVNVLAGCTFDYLGKLVTNENILGGFASRVTYVIHKEKLVREAHFQGKEGADSPERRATRQKLLSDLEQISKLIGPFRGTPELGKLYEEWAPKHEELRQSHPSEKMQSLLVRKPTLMFKLCMILAAAESNDLVLQPHHWTRAMELVDAVESDLPGMLRESQASQSNSQGGLNQAVFRLYDGRKEEAVSRIELRRFLVTKGFEPGKIESTLSAMLSSNILRIDGAGLRLIIDPDNYL